MQRLCVSLSGCQILETVDFGCPKFGSLLRLVYLVADVEKGTAKEVFLQFLRGFACQLPIGSVLTVVSSSARRFAPTWLVVMRSQWQHGRKIPWFLPAAYFRPLGLFCPRQPTIYSTFRMLPVRHDFLSHIFTWLGTSGL